MPGADDANRSKRSRVTFELDPIETMARLTVTHDHLVEGSDMERGIMEGRPRLLPGMKSFLETSRALPIRAGKRSRGTSGDREIRLARSTAGAGPCTDDRRTPDRACVP